MGDWRGNENHSDGLFSVIPFVLRLWPRQGGHLCRRSWLPPDNFELSVTTVESRHPTPPPENGKVMIYVIQRATGTFKFGADGKWLGALKGGTYFHAPVDPGEHHLRVRGQLPLQKGLSLHQLNAKPGETYYFFELTLTRLDPDQGKELVARSRFISSH